MNENLDKILDARDKVFKAVEKWRNTINECGFDKKSTLHYISVARALHSSSRCHKKKTIDIKDG